MIRAAKKVLRGSPHWLTFSDGAMSRAPPERLASASAVLNWEKRNISFGAGRAIDGFAAADVLSAVFFLWRVQAVFACENRHAKNWCATYELHAKAVTGKEFPKRWAESGVCWSQSLGKSTVRSTNTSQLAFAQKLLLSLYTHSNETKGIQVLYARWNSKRQ
jgi:hypothetical protein